MSLNLKLNFSQNTEGALVFIGRVSVFVCCAFWLISSQTLLAHEARPVSVEIVETSQNRFLVVMKSPRTLPKNGLPVLAMPTDCTEVTAEVFSQGRNSYLLKSNFQCTKGLAGQALGIAFPGNRASTNTLFRLTLLSSEKYTHLLSPTEREWKIPPQQSPWTVALDYTDLGVKHIFGGIDHLLFIACLIFIAGTWRRILITITGFTLAHSLTLFLSVFNIITLPVAPVEAVIALSILFLAHEIVVANKQSWTWRYPIAVSSSFGLLHGFGFAAVLKEIGLPQTELVTALLFFNIGVEAGQVLFISCLLLLARSLRLLSFTEPYGGKWARLGGSYFIGTLAAYWFISRLRLFGITLLVN